MPAIDFVFHDYDSALRLFYFFVLYEPYLIEDQHY